MSTSTISPTSTMDSIQAKADLRATFNLHMTPDHLGDDTVVFLLEKLGHRNPQALQIQMTDTDDIQTEAITADLVDSQYVWTPNSGMKEVPHSDQHPLVFDDERWNLASLLHHFRNLITHGVVKEIHLQLLTTL